MTWWLWIKARAIAIGAAVAAVAFAAFKILIKQRDAARDDARRLRATVELQKRVREADSEIDAEYSHRAAEANKDKDDGKVPGNIGKPNDF